MAENPKINYMLKNTYERLASEFRSKHEKLYQKTPEDLLINYETGGGWHDNALFEGALRDQAFLIQQIVDLKHLMANPVFINDLKVDGKTVTIGVEVLLAEIQNGKEKERVRYKVLGPADTRYYPNCLSCYSPLFNCLRGHKVGDIVPCIMGEKTITYAILEAQKITE